MKITGFEVLDLRFPTSLTADGTDAVHKDPDYSAAYVILHTDAGFALCWGAFPLVTAYVAQANGVDGAALLGAGAAFALSSAQRTLSTPARLLRRRVRHPGLRAGGRGLTPGADLSCQPRVGLSEEGVNLLLVIARPQTSGRKSRGSGWSPGGGSARPVGHQ